MKQMMNLFKRRGLRLLIVGVIAIGAYVANGDTTQLKDVLRQIPGGSQISAVLFQDSVSGSTGSASQATGSLVMENVKVYNFDELAYQGNVDLGPTLARIERGEKDSHGNDGSTFGNREQRLPIKSDRSYYTEYVVRTPGISGVGPQRLVIGKDGEVYYTADHYESFTRVNVE